MLAQAAQVGVGGRSVGPGAVVVEVAGAGAGAATGEAAAAVAQPDEPVELGAGVVLVARWGWAEGGTAAQAGSVGERDQAAAHLVDDGDVRAVRQVGAGEVPDADEVAQVEHRAQLTVGPDPVLDRLPGAGQPLAHRGLVPLRGLLDLGGLLDVRTLGGTALAERPRIAVADRLRGSLVALTDAAGLRRGGALGPPAGTAAHDPGAELDRFVRLRDRRCRFPGCRARARACDLDHCRRWPEGATTARNLCCLCEHHHRLKHQAPGWRFDVGEDGALVVTLPDGQTRGSPPPRFGTDLDLPPF